MRFSVPQFIDVEDKIFGPFTFKQFIYLIGGGGIAYIIFRILPALVAIPVIIVVLAFALALAFYKVNNKPFIFTLEALFRYLFQHKLYLWKHRKPDTSDTTKQAAPKQAGAPFSTLSEGKLQDLSWSLDVLDVNDRNT